MDFALDFLECLVKNSLAMESHVQDPEYLIELFLFLMVDLVPRQSARLKVQTKAVAVRFSLSHQRASAAACGNARARVSSVPGYCARGGHGDLV